MKPLIGVFVGGQMREKFCEQIKTNDFPVDFRIYDCMPVGPEPPDFPADTGDVDVLLSTGFTARMLQQKYRQPIVCLETTLYDTLFAVKKVIERQRTPVIVLYRKDKLILNFSAITSLINEKIIVDCYDHPKEVEGIVRRFRGRNVCVIGSGLGCKAAADNGVESYFIYPGESLAGVLRLAVDLAVGIRRDIEKSQQMRAVIQNSKQGIILTDNAGRILLFNTTIRSVLNPASTEIIGRPLEQIIPAYTLKSLRNGTEHDDAGSGEVVNVGDQRFVFNEIPLRHGNKLGHIILFIDDVHSLQQKEYHVREVLANKGFVAKRHFVDYQSFNPSFQRTVRIAKRFARSDEPVVITGETGTGKEVMAQCVHNHSPREGKPFVAINCSAVAENLLESELFGYAAGAFTGARKGGKKGLFEMAHRGTLFLDEVSEMSTPLQSKLLRAIQEKEFIHVGGTELIHFDVRIITASNRNLWDMVIDNKFRADLYYRINVLALFLPPLHEREEDIPHLFLGFIKPHFPELAEVLERDPRLAAILHSYRWPGNIRELENTAKIMSVSLAGEEISVNSFLETLEQQLSLNRGLRMPSSKPAVTLPRNGQRATAAQQALSDAGGNHHQAAAALGISRTTLWRWLKSADTECG